MLKKNQIKIAIIGGGASATLLLAHLDAYNVPCAVDVYDRTGRFARGIAYSTSRLCHLLNVPASNMSALVNDPTNFSGWINQHGFSPADFAPRKLYGDYLADTFKKAEKNIFVQRIKEDVPSCKRAAYGYDLNGKVYDFVVLASGNVRPLSPSVIGHPVNYYPDPWNLPETLKTAKTVALIGSGLTAVDAILSLQDMNFSGQITIFSKHGLLPNVHHTVPQRWSLEGIHPRMTPAAILKAFRTNLREAHLQGICWQAVIDSLRPITNDLWQGWSLSQRSTFLRHLYTIWGVHRHRMAPDIAKKIPKANISFVPSRVNEISDQGIAGYDFDAMINCMGYRYDEPGRHYEVSHRIGPARFGELFETTAIPEIRAQAENIVKDIAERDHRCLGHLQ